MKINIELDPEDLAKFLSSYASMSHTNCRAMEEKIADLMLQALESSSKKKLITKPEELYDGLTH